MSPYSPKNQKVYHRTLLTVTECWPAWGPKLQICQASCCQNHAAESASHSEACGCRRAEASVSHTWAYASPSRTLASCRCQSSVYGRRVLTWHWSVLRPYTTITSQSIPTELQRPCSYGRNFVLYLVYILEQSYKTNVLCNS